MPVVTKDMVPGLVATGGSCRVAVDVPAKFAQGDQILVRNINPVRHTRLPRYVRGRRGVVERDHGVFVFPDTQRPWRGREAAARLQRQVRGAGAVGRRGLAQGSPLHRPVGRLHGARLSFGPAPR